MNIEKHPIIREIYELCLEIEKLPASEQQTKISVMAGDIGRKVEDFIDVNLEAKD